MLQAPALLCWSALTALHPCARPALAPELKSLSQPKAEATLALGFQDAPAADASPEADEVNALKSEVQAAVEAGDYRRARKALDQLEVLEVMAKARAWIDTNDPRSALGPLDRALSLAPETPELLALRAEAAYATAPGDGQPQFFYEEAASFYKRAAQAGYRANGKVMEPKVAEWTLRASQSARRIPRPADALFLAKQAAKAQADLAARGIQTDNKPGLHVAWAEAAFDSYLEAKRSGDQDQADPLFEEARTQLEQAFAAQPENPWALNQLSNLYLWEERNADARQAMERAVELAPNDESTHQAAFRLIWDRFGAEEAASYAKSLRLRWPDSPFGYWYGGSAAFHPAVEAFLAAESVRDISAFQAAEANFAKCRERRPSYAESCLAYEATCRTAVGWCHFNEGKFEAARDAFFSAGELYEGGLQASVDARIWNALAGLTSVAAKFAENPRDVNGQEAAAEIAWQVYQASPNDPDLANNAGFFNRDAAVLRHALAERARLRGVETEDLEERERLLDSAKAQRLKAQDAIERSWLAYEVAAELAPSDVRIVNDAGLIMTYYLRTDPERAQQLLLQAVKAGEEQRAWADPESDLNEAWGDAHQNLAVLYLTWWDEPATAKRYLEKALEVGPASRERMRPMLEHCDMRISGEAEGGGLLDQMVWQDSPPR